MLRNLFCFFIFFVSITQTSCGVSKQQITIDDYFIHQNGIVVNQKNLNAFIFENNLSNIPFQSFLASHFNTNNYNNRTIETSSEGFKFTLVFYDNDEFEKYFGTLNFIIKNLENASEKTGNVNKFVAISVLSDASEDYLNPNSLVQKVAVDYLIKLKNQYLSNYGRSKK